MDKQTKKIKDLKKKIEFILESNPKARNSDQYLTLCIWATYYPEYIFQDGRGKAVLLENIMALPREDNVKRLRAKIQNEEHKWLPTTVEVAKKRGILEEVWYKYVNTN